MKIIKWICLVIIFFLTLSFVAFLLISNSEWLRIDACLDRGGSWNYEKEVCVLS